jgi:hypothetical protein
MIQTEKKYKVYFNLYTGQEVVMLVSDNERDARFHQDLMINKYGYKNTRVSEFEEHYIYCSEHEGFRTYIDDKFPVIFQGKELYQTDNNIWFDSYNLEKNEAHISFVDQDGNLYVFDVGFKLREERED